MNSLFQYVRLCRLMCGKALPFLASVRMFIEAPPPKTSMRRSLTTIKIYLAERQILSAHQAAKPRSFIHTFVSPEEAIHV